MGIKYQLEIMSISIIYLIYQNSMLLEPKSVLFSKPSGPGGLVIGLLSPDFSFEHSLYYLIPVTEPVDFKMIEVK